jgi:hypothetical protein
LGYWKLGDGGLLWNGRQIQGEQESTLYVMESGARLPLMLSVTERQ